MRVEIARWHSSTAHFTVVILDANKIVNAILNGYPYTQLEEGRSSFSLSSTGLLIAVAIYLDRVSSYLNFTRTVF